MCFSQTRVAMTPFNYPAWPRDPCVAFFNLGACSAIKSPSISLLTR